VLKELSNIIFKGARVLEAKALKVRALGAIILEVLY
jgi:hypothetical protein